MNDTALVVDGDNLLVRAVRAMDGTALSYNGVPTGGFLVFVNTLSRYVKDQAADRVVVCWDGGPSTKRTALHAGYKAARVPNPDRVARDAPTPFDLAWEFLDLSGVAQVRVPGVEADDLVACLWKRRQGSMVIVSGDKDLLQLVEDRGVFPVTQVRPGGGDEYWDAERVRRHYGVPEPIHVAKLMALTGDSIDGVKGVPNVGPKRAKALLESHQWSLDAVLADPKMVSHVDLVRRNYALVELHSCDGLPPETDLVEWPPVFVPPTLGSPNWDALQAFFARYGMTHLSVRMEQGRVW